jgi:hypothetical protein
VPEIDVERRDFFKLASGGLMLLLALEGTASSQESGRDHRLHGQG